MEARLPRPEVQSTGRREGERFRKSVAGGNKEGSRSIDQGAREKKESADKGSKKKKRVKADDDDENTRKDWTITEEDEKLRSLLTQAIQKKVSLRELELEQANLDDMDFSGTDCQKTVS